MTRPIFPTTVRVYRIVNDVNKKQYVGSTAQTLAKRFNGHKNNSKKVKNFHLPLYADMNKHGIHSFSIRLLKQYNDVKTFEEQRQLEREWYDKLKPEYNKQAPYRSSKESYEKSITEALSYWSIEKKKCETVQRKHLKKYSADGKFKCIICQYFTNNHSHLKRHFQTKLHLKRVETGFQASSWDEKRFVCDVCKYSTNNRNHFMRHIGSLSHKTFATDCENQIQNIHNEWGLCRVGLSLVETDTFYDYSVSTEQKRLADIAEERMCMHKAFLRELSRCIRKKCKEIKLSQNCCNVCDRKFRTMSYLEEHLQTAYHKKRAELVANVNTVVG